MRIDAPDERTRRACWQVSGRLVGEWVVEFEATCRQLLQASRRLTVDLHELTFVDVAGIEAVRAAGRRGSRVRGWVRIHSPTPESATGVTRRAGYQGAGFGRSMPSFFMR